MNKKYLIKTLSIIAMLAIVGFGSTFAQGDPATTEAQKSVGMIASWIDLIVSMLQWLWIFFASIAGKLLTNSWIYAEGIGMDIYLWKLRNMVKNMSNYIL
jgi:hypothetical protein